MILAGIDEAGYGPVLGPLVVSAVAFEVGEGDHDLWERLRGNILRKPSRKAAGPVAVADSKKLYNRKGKKGIAPLERGVLAFLAAMKNSVPETLPDFMNMVSPGAMTKAGKYPWYEKCDIALPHHAGRTDIELIANSLKVAMRDAGVKLLHMRAETLFAGDFNRMVTASRNKASTGIDITSRHLSRIWSARPEKDMRIIVDRQGGRTHYREILQRIFPDSKMKVLQETDKRSEYLLQDGGRKVEILFVTKGETEAMVVALASMVSKYIREMMMEQFNRFWADRVRGVKPTAGYYVDGRRFFSEIKSEFEKLGLDRKTIYRVK